MNFSELRIEKRILRALEEAGYVEPTPIQQKAIMPVLDGHDLLACAQTGTGKTCAFAVPIIQRLLEKQKSRGTIRALILTPTRELALQIYENICQYSRYTNTMAAVIYGGVSQLPQVEAIERGAEILIATPGRLWDLMGQGFVKLDHVEFFVLDEADRMLDMGFFPDVKRIVKLLPDDRQTLLFSATIPKEIEALANGLLNNPARIAITPSARPVEKIEQQLYFVEKSDKRELLQKILIEKNVHQTLVFTRTKHGADRVARDLNRAGIKAKAIHGDKSQGARQTALREFKELKIAVLVATDIAARGIDISELPLVINFDLPNIAETYVHRIGRTGRAGQEGTAISFCDGSERPYLVDIERLIGRAIPVEGEVPHIEKEPQPPREAQPHKTTNTRSRRKPAAEAKPAAKPQETKQAASKRQGAKPAEKTDAAAPKAANTRRKKPVQPAAATAEKPKTGNARKKQPEGVQESTPARKNRVQREAKQNYQSGGRGGRRPRRDREEDLRVDAHTPARAGALSAEAMERIRQKVAAKLAARGKTAADMPQVDLDAKPTPRRRRSRN